MNSSMLRADNEAPSGYVPLTFAEEMPHSRKCGVFGAALFERDVMRALLEIRRAFQCDQVIVLPVREWTPT